MIESIKILNANYSGLELKYPKGLELDTNAPVVLLNGPNGVGKTALLRMLATSIEFEKYFRREGISHFWDYNADGDDSVKKIIEKLKEAERFQGDEFIKPYAHDTTFEKLCEHRGISYSREVRKIQNRKDENDPCSGVLYFNLPLAFNVISKKGRDEILRLESMLREEIEENIFGFVKPTIGGKGEVYFQNFDLPSDYNHSKEKEVGIRRYVHFVNKDETREGRPISSPGSDLYRNIEKFLTETVDLFFNEQKLVLWERRDYSLEGQLKRTMRFWNKEKPTEPVVEDGKLCIVMDEPTIFLDAVNKFRFQRMILDLAKQYSGRLQFFIASNDYALIHGLEGNCAYLNMYETPAISERKLDIKKYLLP